MKPRLNPFAVAPEAMQAFFEYSKLLLKQGQEQGLEPALMELVKIRASQINGCASCLHMHTAAAREAGETEERLYLLNAWREAPIYTERERAALAWTEALTLLAQTHAPDEDYQGIEAQFSPAERVVLTLLIVVINGWNRGSVGFRAVPQLGEPVRV